MIKKNEQAKQHADNCDRKEPSEDKMISSPDQVPAHDVGRLLAPRLMEIFCQLGGHGCLKMCIETWS